MSDASAPASALSRIMAAVDVRPRLTSFVLGAVAGLGHAPWGFFWLAVPALAALCALHMAAPTTRARWQRIYVAGVGYFALTLFWIVEPFMVDIARHGWMAPFALFFLATGLSVLWALGVYLAERVAHPRTRFAAAATWVIGLTLAEIVRSHLFTGFPWVLIGYIWSETPLAQWFAVFGPHGMTFVTLAFTAGLALVATGPRPALGLSLGVLGLAAALLGTSAAIPATPPTAAAPIVRVVQPNAAQHLKWEPEWAQEFFDRAMDATSAQTEMQPDIIVWPETSVPSLLSQSGYLLDAIGAAAGDAEVVLGIQRREGTLAMNSLVTLTPEGALAAIYDKHHLVPFGEYMPLRDFAARFKLYALGDRLGTGYTPGPGPRLIAFENAGPALPLICYEAIFPHLVNAAPARPGWLLHITNDAWFGEISGPYQHLAQTRLRAIEQGLPAVRSANTGVSAVIDAYGRVVAEIGLGKTGFAEAPLPPKRPPTLYSRTGDWPAYAIVLIGLISLLIFRRRTISD
ncbi:MAG: apolipoprotein N-acyltransferase [Pseudomonadota bacterium]